MPGPDLAALLMAGDGECDTAMERTSFSSVSLSSLLCHAHWTRIEHGTEPRPARKSIRRLRSVGDG